MKVMYKYFSNRLPSNYFDEPTLKLARTNELNDPFEEIVSADLNQITESLYKKENPKNGRFSKTLNAIDNSIYINNCGIVSFSETPRNTLMWSHYTNQHKGICVGYKSDLLKHREKHNVKYPHHYFPIKVNYDNKRYDPSSEIIDGDTLDEKRKNVMIKSLTTKGNDWIYEKEHRIIIPITDFDYIEYFGGALQNIPFSESLIPLGINRFKLKEDMEHILDIIHGDEDFMIKSVICKSDIVSVYFGCNIDQDYKFEIINKIARDNELGHIKIFQVEPHPNDFDLIGRLVDPKKEKRIRRL